MMLASLAMAVLIQTSQTGTPLQGLGVLPAVMSILGVLGIGGAIAFVLKYGTRLSIAELAAQEGKTKGDAATTKTAVLESRVNQQDAIINTIVTRMAKLDKVDEMAAIVANIKEIVERHLVPRAEHEMRWNGCTEKFARLEELIKDK
jgi:hypothetical protein